MVFSKLLPRLKKTSQEINHEFRRVKIINISAPGATIVIYNESTHPELSCRWKADDIFQIAYIDSVEGIVISTTNIKKGTNVKIVVKSLLPTEEDSFPKVFRKFESDVRCPQIEWTQNGPDNIRGNVPGWSWAIAEIERLKVPNSDIMSEYLVLKHIIRQQVSPKGMPKKKWKNFSDFSILRIKVKDWVPLNMGHPI